MCEKYTSETKSSPRRALGESCGAAELPAVRVNIEVASSSRHDAH